MKVYIQVEYELDESEIDELKKKGISKKEDIIRVIQESIDMSTLHENLSKGRVLDLDF